MWFRSARLLFLLVLCLSARSAWADDTADKLVRIHIEAIGGKERIAALKSMRTTGYVIIGAKRMRCTMYAERPNLVRVETENNGRTLVQAFDGVNPPWQFDTGDWPPHYRDMPDNVARTFETDAEFDDPLVAGAARGFTVEYAGEIVGDGKRLIRLLVTWNLSESFSLLLDPDTYFITKRVDERKNALGRVSRIVTEYSDFRPIDGVLLAHEIVLSIDGRVTQRIKIESIETNPEISSETFSRPTAK